MWENTKSDWQLWENYYKYAHVKKKKTVYKGLFPEQEKANFMLPWAETGFKLVWKHFHSEFSSWFYTTSFYHTYIYSKKD